MRGAVGRSENQCYKTWIHDNPPEDNETRGRVRADKTGIQEKTICTRPPI